MRMRFPFSSEMVMILPVPIACCRHTIGDAGMCRGASQAKIPLPGLDRSKILQNCPFRDGKPSALVCRRILGNGHKWHLVRPKIWRWIVTQQNECPIINTPFPDCSSTWAEDTPKDSRHGMSCNEFGFLIKNVLVQKINCSLQRLWNIYFGLNTAVVICKHSVKILLIILNCFIESILQCCDVLWGVVNHFTIRIIYTPWATFSASIDRLYAAASGLLDIPLRRFFLLDHLSLSLS